MREPELVGDCVAAMKSAVAIPVTVKCRLGVDEQDAEEALDRVADAAVAAGVDALDRACAQGLAEGACRRRRTATFPRSTMRASTG